MYSTLKQCDGLWFSGDTQVILRAGDTAFCVSKSILAGRSTVFQSMFEFPQPAVNSGDEMIDGMPVIDLHDDAAEVEPFLRAIFDSSYFMPPPGEIGFHAVLGILRLSHKYDVPYLFKRAILHLETVYPLDLPGFRSRATGNNNLSYKDGIAALDLKAIPILEAVGVTWLLPFVFYSVGTYSAERLCEAGDAWNTLPPETKQTCLALFPTHVRASLQIHAFLSTPSTCIRSEQCDRNKLDFLGLYLRAVRRHQNPLEEWSQPRWTQLGVQLCQQCFHLAQAEYKLAEENIWDQLP
ncbi:hypothetical protein DFH06DRAFT_1068569, partial [Mycena polygramma]